MTFFADLTPFEYSSQAELQGALNVGWLAPFKSRAFGRTPVEFRGKLFALCETPVVRHRGFHLCRMGLCRFRSGRSAVAASLNKRTTWLGSGIILVQGPERAYAAPNLIYHYVTRHWYRPPREFIDAVLAWQGPPATGEPSAA